MLKKIKTFSYSQLSTFKICPQQYKIIYLDGVRKTNESIEAFMEKRVHEVLEWLYSTDNRTRPYISFDELCQTFDNMWLELWHEDIYIADTRKTSDYYYSCLLYTSPSPRDQRGSRMPSSA